MKSGPTSLPDPTRETNDALNHACFCFRLDEAALASALDAELGSPALSDMVRQRCPYLFAAQPVFIGTPHLQRMAQVAQAVESVVALPTYREEALAAAPDIARSGATGTRSVFFGYDFHLNHERLSLIEINTNAGGAMLNAVLARAQRSACPGIGSLMPSLAAVADFEQRIVAMFRREWQLAGHARVLRSVAIVDTAPDEQYLYPEFLLFQHLFERNGLRAVIAAPESLEWREGKLWHGNLTIDLVYNRLTDFYLEQPASAALREAYRSRSVVLTPDPQAHALYADKRRLIILSDGAKLDALGVPQAMQDILLAHVSRTELVVEGDAQRLWDGRKQLFFKPVAGFGSRGSYRGDKLTKRVWSEILASDYVAQALAAPGERMVDGPTDPTPLKFDLRAYAYDGDVQWVAARLYQGQTTNFRTPGGGFAPVYSTATSACRSCDTTTPVHDGPSEYASYVFLLDDASRIHPLPHELYVALARGEATAAEFAGRGLRLVDWYVRLKDGAPDSIANETCRLIGFDAEGKIDQGAMLAHPKQSPVEMISQDIAWPTRDERERMEALLFGSHFR